MVCNVVVRGFDCLPAIANNRLRRVRDLCQSLTAGVITLDVARDAFKMSEIDGLGSDRQDRRYLSRHFDSGLSGRAHWDWDHCRYDEFISRRSRNVFAQK